MVSTEKKAITNFGDTKTAKDKQTRAKTKAKKLNQIAAQKPENYLQKLEVERETLQNKIIKPLSEAILKTPNTYRREKKQKGFIPSWEVSVYRAEDVIKCKKMLASYAGLAVIIRVRRKRNYINKEKSINDYDYVNYYISNYEGIEAKEWEAQIRGHWGIENTVHRTKDVYFNEDKNRITCGNGPEVFSVLTSAAMNILETLNQKSIPSAIEYFRFNFKDVCTYRKNKYSTFI